MLGLLFTYGLTYGGAVVALFRPFYGLLIYICFAVMKPEFLWPWSVSGGNYSRIIALALLTGWALKGFGSWRFARATPLVILLIGYFLWALVAIGFAFNVLVAVAYCEALFKIVLPFIVGITLIDSLSKVKQVAWVLVLSEGFLAYEFNLSYFSGYNRLWYDGFGAMDNNCNAIALVTCVGLAMFLGFTVRQLWLKAVVAGIWLCLVNAILFSFSRGGMLALAITMAFSFFIIPKRPRHYFGFAAAVAIIVMLAGPAVMARFETAFADEGSRDASAAGRLELWTACWKSMLENPLGVGPGHWPLVAPQYGFPLGKQAHSLWLQLGAEFGFPGLALIMTFYVLCLIRVWPMCRERTMVPDLWYRSLARMCTASLIGFCIAAQFVSVYELEHPFYVVLIGAGLLKLKSNERPVATSRSTLGSRVRSFGGMAEQRLRSDITHTLQEHYARDLGVPLSPVSLPQSDFPVLFVGVETAPSRLFSVTARHPVLGEFELPLDSADWTIINHEGEAKLQNGLIVGIRPGRIELKATLQLSNGTRHESDTFVAYVQHLIAETVWIETRDCS
jgi:probable O-glycosylation ligase (exosortase A-associated)